MLQFIRKITEWGWLPPFIIFRVKIKSDKVRILLASPLPDILTFVFGWVCPESVMENLRFIFWLPCCKFYSQISHDLLPNSWRHFYFTSEALNITTQKVLWVQPTFEHKNFAIQLSQSSLEMLWGVQLSVYHSTAEWICGKRKLIVFVEWGLCCWGLCPWITVYSR